MKRTKRMKTKKIHSIRGIGLTHLCIVKMVKSTFEYSFNTKLTLIILIIKRSNSSNSVNNMEFIFWFFNENGNFRVVFFDKINKPKKKKQNEKEI